jgi:hypothetical protein
MKGRWIAVGLTMLAALVPCAVAAAQAKTALDTATIDHLIRAEWKQQNIVPAPPVDDARFLRRLYLDITGEIPPPQAVTAFLADRSPYKRFGAIEALLNSPRYADHWTDYWDGVLMGRQLRFQGQAVDRAAFRQWLHAQFEKNTPWNKFVYDLITATGQNSTGGSYAKSIGLATAPQNAGMPQNGAAMQSSDPAMSMTGGDAAASAGNINGAVNWTLKYATTPADLSGSASKIFLGVQIQCAQCHDHKTEKWKQDDFRRFTACFVQARPVLIDTGKGIKGMRRVELRDVYRPYIGRGKKNQSRNEYVNAVPAALDGTDFSDSPNRRQALAAWMTAPNNPWFAQAIVNRMWAHFLGRGFVEPIDDFRVSNPPVMPDLLKRLADDFVANGYDLKQLIRTLCATQVYQLSSAPAKSADPDNKYWARFRLKPMAPEELLTSLVSATNLGPLLEKVAGNNLEGLKFAMQRQFTFLFDVDEESEQKEFEGTIPQALMLLNGNITNRSVVPIPGTALADVLAMPGGDEAKITALYLRTVSRKPTQPELNRWVAFVNAPRDVVQDDRPAVQPAALGARFPRMQGLLQNGQAPKKQGMRGNGPDPLNRLNPRLDPPNPTPTQQAYEDLFWALLNSSEFMFNH